MDVKKKVDSVRLRENFVAFVDARHDLAVTPEKWRNLTRYDLLEARSAWVREMEGYYENRRLPVPTQPN